MFAPGKSTDRGSRMARAIMGLAGVLLALTAAPAGATAAPAGATAAPAGATAALAGVSVAPAGAEVKAGWDAWQRGDYRTAVEEWRGPAVAGDADAQFNLGQAYKLGRGVPVDPGLAESWFRKAAVQKHPLAEDNYGLALYQSGRRPEALPWLEKSVARGEPRGQLVLGTMLFNGDGVTRDVPRAYALMTRSSQAGLKAASETLAQMDGYVSPADRQKGTALASRYAADQRSPAVAADGRMLVASDAPPIASTPAREAPAPAPPPALKTRPPAKIARAAVKPDAAAKPAAPAERPATTGRYRIQLGAFRDAGNAHALWARVGRRTGGTPSYQNAGGLTRLIATGFASEGVAQRACRASGVSCIVAR